MENDTMINDLQSHGLAFTVHTITERKRIEKDNPKSKYNITETRMIDLEVTYDEGDSSTIGFTREEAAEAARVLKHFSETGEYLYGEEKQKQMDKQEQKQGSNTDRVLSHAA